MQRLRSFRYVAFYLYLTLWQKSQAGPKQKRLCTHCSSWPPTKGPLEEHSPWNDQATSPPRLCRPAEAAGPNTSCPSPERLSNSMNTLNTESLGETGARYSTASKPKLMHSRPHSRAKEEIGRHAALTGYFEWGIVAHCLSQVVAGNADIGTFVRLAPSSVENA